MTALVRILAQVVVEIPPIPPIPPVPDISQFPQAPVPPSDIPPEVLAWLNQVPPELILLPVLGALLIGGSVIFLLTRAIARRIEGTGGKTVKALRDEVTALHERMAEFEAVQSRMAELEERLDFSERLLVQSRPAEAAHRGMDR
jgi:hypothetical protein